MIAFVFMLCLIGLIPLIIKLSRWLEYNDPVLHCLRYYYKSKAGDDVLPFSLDPSLFPLPKRAYPDDAGLDLCAAYTTIIKPNTVDVVDTGVRVAIPEGYVGLLFLRSGFVSERPGVSLANGVGVIDAGYRGNIKVLLKNDWTAPTNIPKGTRFAQLVIIPCFLGKLQFENKLPETPRGDGGFGSTGKE